MDAKIIGRFPKPQQAHIRVAVLRAYHVAENYAMTARRLLRAVEYALEEPAQALKLGTLLDEVEHEMDRLKTRYAELARAAATLRAEKKDRGL